MGKLAEKYAIWSLNPNAYGIRAPGNRCISSSQILLSRFNKKEDQKNKKLWDVADGKLLNEPFQGHGGCGSVMRVAPIGLTFFSDPEKVALWAAEQSKLTHCSSLALASCAAMGIGVALALKGELNCDEIVKEMQNTAQKYDTTTANMIEKAHKYALDKNVQPDFVFNKWQGWAAHEAIAATVFIFVRCCKDNVLKAITMGANTPGDSDSIASMAGSLVGAFSGVANLEKNDLNIMQKMISSVEDSKLIESKVLEIVALC